MAGVRAKARRLVARFLSSVLPQSIMADPAFFGLWERRGYHVLPVHFYSPVPTTHQLERILEQESKLLGLTFDLERHLEFLRSLTRWRDEYDQLPKQSSVRRGFYLQNDNFGSVDAELYYAIVRELRPRRIIEIGGGFSTRLAALAINRNRDDGADTSLTVVEPFPDDELRAGIPAVTSLIRKPLQDVPFEVFDDLDRDDVLFIDSTHVVAPGSDVCIEILELLPRLRQGVLVHLHDIFLPRHYSRRFLLERRFIWNEQYMLQAFLAFNTAFEIVFPAYYVHFHAREALHSAFRFDPAIRPGSFWMRRR
jgi:hypothetical protein